MEGTQQCSSVLDKEQQNVEVAKMKQPTGSFPTNNLETEREQLVEVHQSDRKDEYDTSKKNVFIQPQANFGHLLDTTVAACMPQVQQESISNMELQVTGQNPLNTLDAKLSNIFPTRYARYFQNVGNPLKLTTPLVQGAMQSVVDHAKGLLQTREVMGSYKRLPVAQPLCTEPSSTGQMQLSLSNVVSSYNIKGRIAIPCYPSSVTGEPRLTTPFSFTQTHGEQPCLAISTSSSATPFSNIPTLVCTLPMDTPLRQSEIHASCYTTTTTTDSQPRSLVHNTIDPYPRSVKGTDPRATIVMDTPLGHCDLYTQYCTPSSTDFQPRSMYNSTAPSVGSATHTTSSGHLGLPSSTTTITGVNKKAPVATETGSQHGLSEVTGVLNFPPGRVDAKKFPPRYYDITSLEIGTWKYQRKNLQVVSRLKIIFSQRKFVYEFQLDSNEVAGEGSQQTQADNKQMACIEVPFRTVVGMNIHGVSTNRKLPAEVVIEVDTVPAMWLGRQIVQQRSHGHYTKSHYNTLHTVDLTNGQLSKVPYHKLSVSSTAIMTHLMRFDEKFSALLRIPVRIDPSRSPPEPIKTFQPLTSTKRKRSEADQESFAVSQEQGLDSNPEYLAQWSPNISLLNNNNNKIYCCSCTAGCATKRCRCAKESKKCQDCRCTCNAPCKNPLNILEEFGVDLDEAKNDSCLMQKLFQLNHLRTRLRERSVLTPCCGSRIPLKTCCVGVVECPECETEYRYSWCFSKFCDEENQPRNHCEICQTCRDYRDQHCSHCNNCYFAGSYSFSCPCRNDKEQFKRIFSIGDSI